MPESLLTVLKFCFLALLWLFFLRVLWAVWSEVRAPAPVAAPSRPAAGGGPPGRGSGGPPATGAMRLKVVEPAAARGTTYDLADELTVGRAGGCHVALTEDTFASQLHARLYRRDGRVWLEDLGSTNGTYLNGQPVTEPVALRRGDRVQAGRTVLEVTR